jgi:hypothetical protein
LLLRRWKTVRGLKRAELQALFAANRHLFKAHVLREQLDRLWTYKTRPGVLNFLLGWFKALRWQRLPEMEPLGEFLLKHIGIAAYCDSSRALAWSSRSTRATKAVLRRARGMRDEAMPLLKLKVGHRPPDSVRSRLGALSERSTVVLKSVKTAKRTRTRPWATPAFSGRSAVVAMVQAANFWERDDPTDVRALDRAWRRGVLVPAEMRSTLMRVGHESTEWRRRLRSPHTITSLRHSRRIVPITRSGWVRLGSSIQGVRSRLRVH